MGLGGIFSPSGRPSVVEKKPTLSRVSEEEARALDGGTQESEAGSPLTHHLFALTRQEMLGALGKRKRVRRTREVNKIGKTYGRAYGRIGLPAELLEKLSKKADREDRSGKEETRRRDRGGEKRLAGRVAAFMLTEALHPHTEKRSENGLIEKPPTIVAPQRDSRLEVSKGDGLEKKKWGKKER